jgi:hypothetical protein
MYGEPETAMLNLVQAIHLHQPSPRGFGQFILSTFPCPSGNSLITLYGANEEGPFEAWTGDVYDKKVSLVLQNLLGNEASRDIC